MTVFIITVLVFGLVIAAMSVGVLAGRQPIKGSCGGIGALGIDQSCEICGGNAQRCDEETRDPAERKSGDRSALYYSADKE